MSGFVSMMSLLRDSSYSNWKDVLIEKGFVHEFSVVLDDGTQGYFNRRTYVEETLAERKLQPWTMIVNRNRWDEKVILVFSDSTDAVYARLML
jgi:dTDP-4-dehydrorhamnose 3,5-epimerase-like enzyme